MKNCTAEQFEEITHYFSLLQRQSVGVYHCSGVDKLADLHSECKTYLFYNYADNEISYSVIIIYDNCVKRFAS